MSHRLRALNRLLVTLESYAVGGLVVTVFIVVLLQVGMRYLLSYPNPWSEEVSRFCFIWMSLLGASLAVERRAHFGFDQIMDGLAPRAKRSVEVFAGAVVLIFALLLIITGVVLIDLTMGERSSALNLPVALVYASVPVAGVLMGVHLLARSELTEEPDGMNQSTVFGMRDKPVVSGELDGLLEPTVEDPATKGTN